MGASGQERTRDECHVQWRGVLRNNECAVLKDVVERYGECTGHYPKRVLVDRVYRTKENRAYCEERGIEMSVRVANLFGVRLPPLFLFYFMDAPDAAPACHLPEIEDGAA